MNNKAIKIKETNILSAIENVDVLAESVLTDDDMARMSNEESVLSRYDYPRLQFDGGKGQYIFNDKALNNVRMIMLKFRRHYGAFSPRNEKPSWVMWTSEVNNDNTKVDLFRKEEGREVEKVGTDYIFKLKQTFAICDLKMQQDVYGVLVADGIIPQLCKITFKKTGVKAIFDFYKEFPYGEHIYNYIVILGAKKIVNDRREEYYIPTFEKGRELTEKNELLALKNAMLEIENAVKTNRTQDDEAHSDSAIIDDLPEYRMNEAPQDEFDRFVEEAEEREEAPKIAKTAEEVQAQIRERVEKCKNRG